MADEPLDPGRDALVRALNATGAQYLIIGGAALQTHRQPHRTDDVDITPARSDENLTRLAAALNALQCSIVVDPLDRTQDVPLPPGYFTAAVLRRQQIWNLMTIHSKLDITFAPTAFPDGYDALRPRAETLTIAQTTTTAQVASLEDVEHAKRVIGRAKDREYLTRVGRLEPPPGRQPTKPGTEPPS